MNKRYLWVRWLTQPCIWLLGLALLTTGNLAAAAPAVLESPSAAAFARSGVGLIRGWACNAKQIEVSIDGGPRQVVGYGTKRLDVAATCGGQENVGFGLTFNWNSLPDGIHTIQAFADGQEFANTDFTVATLGKDFINDLIANYLIPNFPSAGKPAPIAWSTAHQNFVFSKDATIPPPADPPVTQIRAVLESPTQGSHESGVGLIRGWACDASKIEISIDGGARQPAAYGTVRTDAAAACSGKQNVGFGLTFNWNTLKDGAHQVQAFADGVEFAKVTFAATNLGSQYLTGITKEIVVKDFPNAGQTTNLRWSTPDQNFTISQSTATPSKAAIISLVNDALNTFAVSGLGARANSTETIGVYADKNASPLATGGATTITKLKGVTWGSTKTKQTANIQLRDDGLPGIYTDSKGVKAEFSNLTENSITITFKDKSDKPIGNPVSTKIDPAFIIKLRDTAQQVFAKKQTADAVRGGQQYAEATGRENSYNFAKPAATVEQLFHLNKILTNAFWYGGQTSGELLCGVAQAAQTVGIKDSVAPTACGSALIVDLRKNATVRNVQVDDGDVAVDADARRSLQFVADVIDVPCPSGDPNACALLPAAELVQREAAIPEPIPPTDPTPPGPDPNQIFTVFSSAGPGGSITPDMQKIRAGSGAVFFITPDPNHKIGTISGCNGGKLDATATPAVYTTAPITAECTLSVTFVRNAAQVDVSGTWAGTITQTNGCVSPIKTLKFEQVGTQLTGYFDLDSSPCNGSVDDGDSFVGSVQGYAIMFSSTSGYWSVSGNISQDGNSISGVDSHESPHWNGATWQLVRQGGSNPNPCPGCSYQTPQQ